MLYIFYADISRLDVSASYPLSEYRLDRISKLRTPGQIRQSIGAEMLLEHAAVELCPELNLPLEIDCGKNRKPFLKSGAFFFSLSHSENYAAAAVSDVEIGLDVQKRTACNIALAQRFFAADELGLLEERGYSDRCFTELWCRKESYIKALGTGLGTGLNSFSVLDMPWLWYGEDGIYHFAVCSRSGVYLQPEKFEKKELL